MKYMIYSSVWWWTTCLVTAWWLCPITARECKTGVMWSHQTYKLAWYKHPSRPPSFFFYTFTQKFFDTPMKYMIYLSVWWWTTCLVTAWWLCPITARECKTGVMWSHQTYKLAWYKHPSRPPSFFFYTFTQKFFDTPMKYMIYLSVWWWTTCLVTAWWLCSTIARECKTGVMWSHYPIIRVT